MNKIIPFILCFIVGAFGVCTLSITYSYYKQSQLINAYKQYYTGTEELLDEIDAAYNWVDGYESYDYYSSKAKIDSLTNSMQ